MASVKRFSPRGFFLFSFSILVFAGCVLGQEDGAEGGGGEGGGGEGGGGGGTPGKACQGKEGGHHVLLMVDVPKNQGLPQEVRCGGTLIGQDWVLTARECWNPKLVAFLGDQDDLKKREKVKIKKHYIHEDSNGQHDLMLLQLDRPKIKWFSTKFHVIGLPDKNHCTEPVEGATVQLVGWKEAGLAVEPSTFLTSSFAPKPVCARLTVAACADFSEKTNSKDLLDKSFSYTKLVCAGGESDNTCSGAAGGGMIYNSMLYGVVKGSTKGSCSSPVKFTSLCPYRKWIVDTRGK